MTTQNTFSWKGFYLTLISTLLFSTNYVTAKLGLKGFNPLTFSLVWTGSAAFYTTIFLTFKGELSELHIKGRTVLYLYLIGIATGAGMMLTWAGLKELDPSFNAFLWQFLPVLSILMAIIVLKESFHLSELIPFLIMIVGGIYSTTGRWHIVGKGTTLTLIACLLGAVQMVVSKMIIEEVGPNVMVFYRTFIGTIVIGVWGLVTDGINLHNADMASWGYTLLGGLLGPSLSFFLLYRAYGCWELSRCSITMTVQPLFVAPLAYLVFHKLPVLREIIGGIIIMAGALCFIIIHYRAIRRGDGE